MQLDPEVLGDADVLGLFTEFSVPLLLLDSQGHALRGNERFANDFRVGSLDRSQLDRLAQVPDGGWIDLNLVTQSGAPVEVKARVARTSRHVLLIVGAEKERRRTGRLEALKDRIGRLEREVSTDHLTGAWNRAHLDRMIESELARSMTAHQPLSLVLIDIDHFKNVNDTFGHAVGDRVLCELVGILRSNVRAADLVFRWGGEEFVVLLSGAGYRRAGRIAELLRKAVAEHAFSVAGSVTISLGVAEHDGEEGHSEWFKRLDEALYKAKAGGRNRVEVAPSGNSDRWAAGGAAVLNLAWHEAFECGEPTIDAEHRMLFERANALVDAAMRENSAPGSVKALLAELLAHVQKHFADEEAILARLNYVGLAEQKRSHAGLLRRAGVLAVKFEAGKVGIGAIVEFLAQDVVARHMLMVDRAFFPLFANADGQSA